MFDKNTDISRETLSVEHQNRVQALVSYADAKLFESLTPNGQPKQRSDVKIRPKDRLALVHIQKIKPADERLQAANYDKTLVKAVDDAKNSLTYLLNNSLPVGSAITPEQAFLLIEVIYRTGGKTEKLPFDIEKQVREYAAECNPGNVDRQLERYMKDQAAKSEISGPQR